MWSICGWAAALRDRASLARSSRLAARACLGLLLEVVEGVLELLSCSSMPLLGGGDVDEGPAHLGDLLEHLLVGEVEHLVGLLRGVERLVGLGLHDVVCPLEDSHDFLPGVDRKTPTIDSAQPACVVGGRPSDAKSSSTTAPLAWV